LCLVLVLPCDPKRILPCFGSSRNAEMRVTFPGIEAIEAVAFLLKKADI
jgi:hypothetical protein